MRKNAEKPDFADARAVRVCEKAMAVSDIKQKSRIFTGF